jgi:DNA-binding IclR family transcriptional regulator
MGRIYASAVQKHSGVSLFFLYIEKNEQIHAMKSTNKALVLLKQVGIHNAQGARLTDLIEASGFDKSTVHRLLGSLLDEGFVERVPTTKLYRLGLESMQLGFASSNMAPLVDRFRPLLVKTASLTEDTVFLVVRSGDHAVCVHREEGAYPIKVFLIAPGNRRPLGLSAVGVAILAQEHDDEVARIYARHNVTYAKVGLSLERLRGMVNFVRTRGYSEMTDFVLPGTAGLGCASRISAATQIGISIAAVSNRMTDQRRHELGALLVAELQAACCDTPTLMA